MFLCQIPTSCPPVPPRETRTIFNHQPQQFMQLKSFFKGISVTLIHRLGLKKTRGLVPNTGNFEFKNTTVKDYFKKARGRRIEYPNIIGIQVGSKDRDKVIPAEINLQLSAHERDVLASLSMGLGVSREDSFRMMETCDGCSKVLVRSALNAHILLGECGRHRS
ncbi:hypothetical protein BDR05DRAFT_969720 [Suillus weaverae]|nr:hypothetical protein BDR05DRAFT_969720 [Suillus weaverae]